VPTEPVIDLAALWPSVVLAAGGLLVLLLEVASPGLRRLVGAVAAASVVASCGVLYATGRTAGPSTVGEVGTDLLVLAMAPAFYLSALGCLVLGGPYLRRGDRTRGEFQALVLFSTAGMLLLVQARDLLMFFLGLETLSIPLYVLAGFFTDQRRSVESALKYFTVGAFSSAFVAFGAALVYGAAGDLTLHGAREGILAAQASGDAGRVAMANAGLAFFLVGLGFKVAMVPFHAWAADVYQGAPTPVTALLSVGSKAAGVAGLVRILVEVFPDLLRWATVLAVLAALTLVVGSCVAMLQEDIKRLIAYSGISHVGFLLMALVSWARLGGAGGEAGALADDQALRALAFYLVAYALMTTGALAVVAIVEREYLRDTLILDYAGLAARRPGLALAMLVLLLSLGGMPPLAGFVGKWLVFRVALDAGLGWLAVVAALSSVIGFYYYLRVVLQMYLRPPRAEASELEAAAGPWALVGATTVATIVLGVLPQAVLAFLSVDGAALARALG
jgi:NADH-quinone oxidoreductase subunit N